MANNNWQGVQGIPVVEKIPLRKTSNSKRQQSWLVRRWRYFYFRLQNLRGSKSAIARGFAVGVFAGCFPLLGFQIIIGVLLAVLLRGNKFAAAAGTWISNPLTYVPIFAFNYQVGQWLLNWHELSGDEIDFQSASAIIESGWMLIATLFVGCFVVGTIAAICSYFFGLWLIARLRSSRQYLRRSPERKPQKKISLK